MTKLVVGDVIAALQILFGLLNDDDFGIRFPQVVIVSRNRGRYCQFDERVSRNVLRIVAVSDLSDSASAADSTC
jgi:hypothetical protein